MRDDPVQTDACAECGKQLAPIKSAYARGHLDPFCSAQCCRLYYGVPIPGDDEPLARSRSGPVDRMLTP